MAGTSTDDQHFYSYGLIIGGGTAGILLALKLANFCNVTLVDCKDFMFINSVAPKAIVEKEVIEQLFIPYRKTFENFKKKKLVRINQEENVAIFEDGTQIEYKFLVLATGCSYTFPVKFTISQSETFESSIKMYKDLNHELACVTNVVIVADCPVGIEIAAEIKTKMPHKEVTVLFENDVLISEQLTRKTTKAITDALHKMKINLVLAGKVQNKDDISWNKSCKQILKTAIGKELECDLAISCFNVNSIKELYGSSLPDSINKFGQIKVDMYFKVNGTANIYAIGSITNTAEEKTEHLGTVHANCLANNISAALDRREPKKYSPGNMKMNLLLGRNCGVTQIKGFTFGNFVTLKLKNWDMVIKQTWKKMGRKF